MFNEKEIFFMRIWTFMIILLLAVLTILTFTTITNENSQDTDLFLISLIQNLDQKVDPCIDFFDFVCNNDNRNVANTETVSNFSSNNNEMLKSLEKVLNSKIAKGEWRPSILVKQFYKSCLKADYNKNKVVVIKQLKELGGWPVLEGDSWNEHNFEWIDLMGKFKKMGYSFEVFVKFSIIPYQHDMGYYILGLAPPEQQYLLSHVISSEAYLELMVNISVELGSSNRSQVQKQLNESMQFEMKLVDAMIQIPSNNTFATDITFHELQTKYESIPWLKYINKVLFGDNILTDSDRVFIDRAHRDYFKHLQNLIKDTDKRILANYAFWIAILEKIDYFPESIYNIYLKTIRAFNLEPRKHISDLSCVEMTHKSFEYVTSSLYVNYINLHQGHTVKEMFEYLKSGLRKHLFHISLNKDLELQILKKIEEMLILIGTIYNDEELQEYYKDLQLDSKGYFDNSLKIYIHEVNYRYKIILKQKLGFNNRSRPIKDYNQRIMFRGVEYHKPNEWIEPDLLKYLPVSYIFSRNSIYVRSNILQLPFFNKSLPMYFNFGSLGYSIGREIMHGILDRNKRILSQWVNPTENNSDIEAIANTEGLKLAYSAYYNWLQHNSEEKSEISARKMFWISAVKNWCTVSKREYLQHLFEIDEEQVPKFKKLFNYSKEFLVAYGCNI